LTLDGLTGMGCDLKDLEKGLVDFRSLRGGEQIFLCWQEGEESIAWWHPLDSGFAGRRQIEGAEGDKE
jgi:hypothetical protein